MTIKYFETERLCFRGWQEEDKPEFALMNADPEVMQYFLRRLDESESNAFVSRIESHFAARGYGLWAVELKQNKEFIGFIGLTCTSFESDFTPCIEIGWRLKKSCWGNGYATEGAGGCLFYGFNTLGLTEIYSFTSVLNKRSERIMQKIGMTKIKEFSHPNVPAANPLNKHVLYRIGKDEPVL